MAVNEHVIELIPAYALECLDPDENVRVMEHLASCGFCEQELRQYKAITDRLPLATPDAHPSPAAKEKLMRRIEQSIQPSETLRTKGTEPKPSLWERLSVRLRMGSPAWSFAGLALIVVLLASNFLLLRQVTLGNSSGGQTALQVVNLAGTDNAPQAIGMIVISKDGSTGTLVVDRLPALAVDHQYQLWLNKDGERVSGGVFSVDEAGYASLWVWSSDPLVEYKSFGITVEPTGGSPGPTGKKVLGGSL